jgi:hypothetical protein
MTIANTHQICQCDKTPSVIKKAFVQPASAPNRHAPIPPTTTATGVNKNPNSDNAGLNRTWAITSSQLGSVCQRAVILISIDSIF